MSPFFKLEWILATFIHSSFYFIHLSKSCQRANFGGKKSRMATTWIQLHFRYDCKLKWPRLSKVKMGSLGPKKLSSTCRVDLATICENLLYCSTTTYANICLVILLLSISQGVSVAAAAADSETELAGALFSVLANPRPATPFIIRRENH